MSFIYPNAMQKREIRKGKRELESEKKEQERDLRCKTREKEKKLAEQEKDLKDREKKVRQAEKELVKERERLRLLKEELDNKAGDPTHGELPKEDADAKGPAADHYDEADLGEFGDGEGPKPVRGQVNRGDTK